MASSSVNLGDEKHGTDLDSLRTFRNILITGGAGFIGSNVTIQLVTKYPDYRFIVVDKLSYSANLKNLAPIAEAKNFKFVRGSICSMDLMEHVFGEYAVDAVMHFAAESHVDLSFENALVFTENNVVGTHVLLECAKKRSAAGSFGLFLHISTDEVYGDSNHGAPSKEDARLLPTNPYAARKAAAEMMVRSYSVSFGLPVVVTRSSNIFGPRQFPEKLVPKFIELLLKGQSVCIYGDGQNTRTFLYVLDLAEALDVVLHHAECGQSYNITSDDTLNTKQVARAIMGCLDSIDAADYDQHIDFVTDRKCHDSSYHIDGAKLAALGWTASTEFETGLRETVDWYRQNRGHWKGLDEVLVPHPKIHHQTNKAFVADSDEELESEENEESKEEE